jgi:hypothetical protein
MTQAPKARARTRARSANGTLREDLREPRHYCGRWETIRYALDSWARTFRLCLILLVAAAVSSGVASTVAVLIHHAL